MTDELRLASAHVIVDPGALGDDRPELAPDDAHHLGRVLRLRPGEVVTATDGAGRWRRTRWAPEAQRPSLCAEGPVHTVIRPDPAITVGFAPVKGDRPEWAVQKLTELGVDRIVILRAARSIVRFDSAKVARLQAVVRAAVMQSRQCHVPQVLGPLTLTDVPGAALADPDGGELDLGSPAVLIGPEGGWEDIELAEDRRHVTLGPAVLRAETAAVAAAVLLCSLRNRRIPTERGRIT